MPETNWAESQFGTPKDDQGTRIFNAPEHPFYMGSSASKETWSCGRAINLTRVNCQCAASVAL